MPIDPSIIAGLQPQTFNPTQALQQGMQLRALGQEQQLRAAQIEDVKAQQVQRQKAQQDANALDAAYASGDTWDKVLASVPGHLRSTVQKSRDEAEAAADKQRKAKADADEAERDYFGALASGVKPFLDSGDTDSAMGAVKVALSHAKERGYPEADEIWQNIQQNPQALPKLVDGMIAQSPKFSQLATTQAANKATQANAAASQAREAASAAETARHNQEMERIQGLNEGREAAAQAETARHNRETEKAANPFAAMPGAAGSPSATGEPTKGLTGDDFLKTLPQGLATQVKSYAEGRQQFPSGFALKSPYFQTMLQMVGQYDPEFDATNFNGRNKARQDFTAGASAKQITALNTVIGHLGDLSEKTDALNNGSVPAVNAVKNWLKTQTGSSDVSNFNTVKKGVTDELTRVWRQAGGSEQDIKSWGESLGASQSPEQLMGALKTIGGMLRARLDALENQKQQGLGKFGSDIKVITPKSEAILKALDAGEKPSTVGAIPGIPAIGDTFQGGKVLKVEKVK